MEEGAVDKVTSVTDANYPWLVLVPLLYGTGMMSLEYVNKLGYILAVAICAIG